MDQLNDDTLNHHHREFSPTDDGVVVIGKPLEAFCLRAKSVIELPMRRKA